MFIFCNIQKISPAPFNSVIYYFITFSIPIFKFPLKSSHSRGPEKGRTPKSVHYVHSTF